MRAPYFLPFLIKGDQSNYSLSPKGSKQTTIHHICYDPKRKWKCLFSTSCVFIFHRCSSRIISTMQSTAATCTGWAPAPPTSRTGRGTLTKRRPTSSSRDTRPTAPRSTCTISVTPTGRLSWYWNNKKALASFSKLLLIGSAHLRYVKESHSCPHTC